MGAVSSSTSPTTFPPLHDFLHPTPQTYSIYLNIFQYFPLFTILQWFLSYHPAGKTSLASSVFNIPGRIAWFIMEIAGAVNLTYTLVTTTTTTSSGRVPPLVLPVANRLVAGLYIVHYINRAIISPFFAAPSMSPIHVLVMGLAVGFNWLNSMCLAGWLLGYETPVIIAPGGRMMNTAAAPSMIRGGGGGRNILPVLGLGLFFTGMIGNIYSERTLFRLRREEAERRERERITKEKRDGENTSDANGSKEAKNKYHKVYVIPPSTGIFRSMLYPHYVFEWFEWLGFVLVGTAVFPASSLSASSSSATSTRYTASAMSTPPIRLAPWLIPFAWLAERLGVPLPLPAVVFLVNAVANMLPHARWGRKWYVQKFGEEKVRGRGAVVPWCEWM